MTRVVAKDGRTDAQHKHDVATYALELLPEVGPALARLALQCDMLAQWGWERADTSYAARRLHMLAQALNQGDLYADLKVMADATAAAVTTETN